MKYLRRALLLASALGPGTNLRAADAPKLKVFILAGQSNMEGQAVADLDGIGPRASVPSTAHASRSAQRAAGRHAAAPDRAGLTAFGGSTSHRPPWPVAGSLTT